MAHKTIDIAHLKGQTWPVTDATSGVGLETVRSASGHGARVFLAVRDSARGRQVAPELPGDARVVRRIWPRSRACDARPAN